MILKYNLSDNRLEKKDPTDFPNHLQDNIVLEFDKNSSLPNDNYYAYIKTPDAVKKVKVTETGGKYSCELPPFVSHYPFFKVQIMGLVDEKRFVSNELIVPFRTLDYLDYNRSMNVLFNQKYAIKHTHKDKEQGQDEPTHDEPTPIPIDIDTYNKDELDTLLNEKADLIHQHQAEDITDWDEEVDENIDLLLHNLTNRIRGI